MALGRTTQPMRPGGGLLLGLLWLLGPAAGGECVPRDLRCSKACCEAPFSCPVTCSWEADCEAGATFSLNIRYPNAGAAPSRFEAGAATSVQFSQDRVYALRNATLWVEGRAGPGPPQVSEGLTLLISRAVRLPAVPAAAVASSRSGGLLTLTWPDPRTCHSAARETGARIRPPNAAPWSTGNCTSVKPGNFGNDLAVTCVPPENIPYLVQVRQRLAHWSSSWSEWSSSIIVPAALLRSPRVNYTVQRLRDDGLRNLTLEWEAPGADFGPVSYSVATLPLLCPPACSEPGEAWLGNQTRHQEALSGCGYNVSLWAENAAGLSPPFQLHVPPEGQAGPAFLAVHQSGGNASLTWRAKTDAQLLCLEQGIVGGPAPEVICRPASLRAGDDGRSSAALPPGTCSRLALHGWDADSETWRTFGLAHLLHRRAAAEDRIALRVANRTGHSATVLWEPPRSLATCPGALEGYVLCFRPEEGGHATRLSLAATDTRLTLSGLRPGTAYRVGLVAVTTEQAEACRAQLPFLTPPDGKQDPRRLGWLSLGVAGGLLAASAGFHCGRKRIMGALFPPSPDPEGVEALKLLRANQEDQGHLRRGFLQPLEPTGPPDPLVLDPLPPKQEPPAPPAGPPAATEALPAPCEVLPSPGYKRQGLLGRDPGEDPLGHPDGAGATRPPSLRQAGGTLPTRTTFLLLDKLVVALSEDGLFEVRPHAEASS